MALRLILVFSFFVCFVSALVTQSAHAQPAAFLRPNSQSSLPLIQNSFVDDELDDLRDRNDVVTRALTLRHQYEATYGYILNQEGLPHELLNLLVMQEIYGQGDESGFQVSPDLGRLYGLRVDRFQDDRNNRQASAQATALYLKHLYNLFGDWHLALGAYFTSPGAVKEAIAVSKLYNLWKMVQRGALSKTARNQVARFMAVSILIEEAENPELFRNT